MDKEGDRVEGAEDSPENMKHLEPNPIKITMHPQHQPMQCKQVDIATPSPIHTNDSTTGTCVIVVCMRFHIGALAKHALINAESPIIWRVVITQMQQPLKQQAIGYFRPENTNCTYLRDLVWDSIDGY